MRLFAFVTGVIAMLVAPGGADAQTKVVRLGHLWDGSRVVSNAFVVIEGTRVTTVVDDGFKIPNGAEVIDLRSADLQVRGAGHTSASLQYWMHFAISAMRSDPGGTGYSNSIVA